MNHPKVTVLMAVHNGELHLRESIDSILGQSFYDFEFLVINDGSTDQSRELILSYRDPRVRLVDNEIKLGLTRSLNRGLSLAAGEFIARQDADDVSEQDRLLRQRIFLEANPETALVGSWYKKIDDSGAELGTRQLPCEWVEIRWAVLFLCPFVHSAVMLRKELVARNIGFYDNSFIYAQDYDLWSRIVARLPAANLPEYLVRYRVGPGSMTSTYGAIVGDEIRRTSITNLAILIGRKAATTFVRADAEFANVCQLLFGDYRHLGVEEAIAASRRVMWLLDAFLRCFEDSRNAEFEVKVRSQVARRLLEIGNRGTDAARGMAGQLAVEACRLHWPQAFKWQLLQLLFKLLKRELAEMGPAVRG